MERLNPFGPFFGSKVCSYGVDLLRKGIDFLYVKPSSFFSRTTASSTYELISITMLGTLYPPPQKSGDIKIPARPLQWLGGRDEAEKPDGPASILALTPLAGHDFRVRWTSLSLLLQLLCNKEDNAFYCKGTERLKKTNLKPLCPRCIIMFNKWQLLFLLEDILFVLFHWLQCLSTLSK